MKQQNTVNTDLNSNTEKECSNTALYSNAT
jgi:hypothetical protein